MKRYYVNDDHKVYAYELKDGIISFYSDEKLIVSTKSRLKEINLPIKPIYHDGYLILFDYEKGIEIIKVDDGTVTFIKLLAVNGVLMLKDKLLAFKLSKICVIDYKTGEILEEKGRSGNLEFRKNDRFAFFYRAKNNKSYLYNIETKEVTELKTKIELDSLILQIEVIDDNLYLFHSVRLMSTRHSGVIIYNLKKHMYEMESIDENGSATGSEFLGHFQVALDKNVEINYKGYGERMLSLIKKYGLQTTFYLANEHNIALLENTKFSKIAKGLKQYIQIIKKYIELKDGYGGIHSFDDFSNYQKETMQIEKELRSLDIK